MLFYFLKKYYEFLELLCCLISVIFHVATLMPNKDSDPNCNAKKLHIGNDYVTIVYNDSNEDYRIGIIKVTHSITEYVTLVHVQ